MEKPSWGTWSLTSPLFCSFPLVVVVVVVCCCCCCWFKTRSDHALYTADSMKNQLPRLLLIENTKRWNRHISIFSFELLSFKCFGNRRFSDRWLRNIFLFRLFSTNLAQIWCITWISQQFAEKLWSNLVVICPGRSRQRRLSGYPGWITPQHS